MSSNMAVAAIFVMGMALLMNHVTGRVMHKQDTNDMLQKLVAELDGTEHEHERRNSHLEPLIHYYNARIYTVDENDPNWHTNPKDTIVWQGKTIVYVGDRQNAPHFNRRRDERYDMWQATIIPGIHDVHQHPLEATSKAGASCELSEFDDLETLAAEIQRSGCAYEGVDPSWALGHGHSIIKVLDNIKAKGRTPREILDEAIPDIPAVMMEATSHSVWVNSKALEVANITETTPDGNGGIIWRDSDGRPNGILLENWGNRIMSLAMKPTPNIVYENERGLKKAIKLLNRNGITSVCDARVYWQRGHDEIWKNLRRQTPNDFTIRAVMDLWAAPEMNDNYQIAEIKKRYSENDDLLKFAGVKVYIDGLLQSTTAAMLNRYKVNYHFPKVGDKNIGINYFTEQRLASYMRQLQDIGNNKGYDFNVHAIGDRGIREVLNAINASQPYQNPSRPARHRLTHVEIADPADFGRFKKLNAIADFQVAGDYTLPSARGEIAEFIGDTKARRNVPVRSIADTGAMVTFSSDWDVSQVKPFVGMHNAVRRGDQSVTMKKALEMYTRNAAFVMRQEDKVGTLVPGKEADFVVIDRDILDPRKRNSIKRTRVLETVFRGRSVYCPGC